MLVAFGRRRRRRRRRFGGDDRTCRWWRSSRCVGRFSWTRRRRSRSSSCCCCCRLFDKSDRLEHLQLRQFAAGRLSLVNNDQLGVVVVVVVVVASLVHELFGRALQVHADHFVVVVVVALLLLFASFYFFSLCLAVAVLDQHGGRVADLSRCRGRSDVKRGRGRLGGHCGSRLNGELVTSVACARRRCDCLFVVCCCCSCCCCQQRLLVGRLVFGLGVSIAALGVLDFGGHLGRLDDRDVLLVVVGVDSGGRCCGRRAARDGRVGERVGRERARAPDDVDVLDERLELALVREALGRERYVGGVGVAGRALDLEAVLGARRRADHSCARLLLVVLLSLLEEKLVSEDGIVDDGRGVAEAGVTRLVHANGGVARQHRRGGRCRQRRVGHRRADGVWRAASAQATATREHLGGGERCGCGQYGRIVGVVIGAGRLIATAAATGELRRRER